MTERGRPRSFDRDIALGRAMEVFWRKGYEGASMVDLTAAMGIAAPSLYAAFGSKEGLFREALALYRATENIWGAVKDAPTALDAIEGFLLESARAFTRPNRPRGCLVVLSAIHATGAHESVRRELIRSRAQTVEGLANRLARGVEAGEIASDANVPAIARYYAAVQQGMSIQASDGASRATLEAIAHAALSAWGALTCRRTKPSRKSNRS